jgi:hypothetical protein
MKISYGPAGAWARVLPLLARPRFTEFASSQAMEWENPK